MRQILAFAMKRLMDSGLNVLRNLIQQRRIFTATMDYVFILLDSF